MNQRARHVNDKMLPDRKELLDKIGFVWKADFLATRSSSTTDVRCLVIGSFYALGRYHISHSRYFSAYLCRLRIRKLSLAVWVSQTKHHQKNWNHPEAATEPIVHLPIESDQALALSKPDKWPLEQESKEARLQIAVVSMKKIQARLW
jgi:hypothetical protein